LFTFTALTLLVGQQEGHSACKNWAVRYWQGYLSGVRCKWVAYGLADATVNPSSLAPVKSRMVYLSGASLPRLSWKKGCKMDVHRVSKKNVPHLACYNFDAHEWILIFFGRIVTDKVGNQNPKTLYYATSSNLCFCTTWQNAETRKLHISLNWIVLHTQCTCALSSWKKKCHLWCVW